MLNRTILKAMGIFGGTQALVILLGIVRNKFLALWLGPAGVGLNAIFISTQDLFVAAGGLSLRTGGVRELAAAPDSSRARTAGVLLRMASALAVAGGAAAIALSPLLSLWTMGDYHHWWCFMLLAFGIAATIRLDADIAALQAAGQLKALARVTAMSTSVCTAAAIPLYYMLGLMAVLPVYLLMSLVSAAWARHERRRYCPPAERVALRPALREARPMLRLGIYLTLAAVMERLAGYLFVVYMSNDALADALGIYQSGYTLVNTYVMVIFTAISTEYYPRLASVAGSRLRTQAFACAEFKVAAWVLMPVVAAFISLSQTAVRLLYSGRFDAVVPYVDFGVCGVMLRAFSYCIAFVVLARGDGRTFVLTEAAGAMLGLVLRIAGYRLWGFAGMGVAYIVEYALYSTVVVAAYRHYGLRLCRGTGALAIASTGFALLCVCVKTWLAWWVPLLALPVLVPLALHRLNLKLPPVVRNK